MKLSEIQSHHISHRINIPFPIKWSEDDVLATATEKGIQILEVMYNPNNKVATINCHRHHVNNNETKPTNDVGIDVATIFMKADMSEALNLVLNQDIAPQLEKANSLQSVIRQIEWSSVYGLQSFRRCILAYVTNAGQVSLIGYKYTSWVELLDLSKIWKIHCKKNWGATSLSIKHQISELTYRAGRIKFTAITWIKETFSENNVSHLITASQDGVITLWKIFNARNNINNDMEESIGEKQTLEITADVLKSFDSKLQHISIMSWHGTILNTGYLIISNTEGHISYIKDLKINEENEVMKEFIWNIADKVPVTNIICWDYGKGFVAVAVKGSFIVVAYIDTTAGNLISVCYHNTRMRFITGLQKVSENSILISSRNNKFSMLNMVFNGDDIVIHESDIECGFVKNRYALLGVALSRNKVLGAAIISVSGAYDHIAVREPSSLLFFSLSEINEPLEKMLSSDFEQINDVWDCFDVVRWQILNKIITYALPENLQSALDTMELKQLIITMWLTKFLTTASEIDEIEGDGIGETHKEKSTALENTFEEIEELVFSCNIFKRCANLITNIKDLSPFDKESLALMRNWLDHLILSLPESHITTKSSAATLLEEINDLIKIHSVVLPEIEKCCICQEDVPCLTGFKTSRCRRGHTLLRCSLSLVQISYDKSYRCSRCNAVAHVLAVTGDSTNCIFCNSPLRIDGRLLDITDVDENIDEEQIRAELDKLLSKTV